MRFPNLGENESIPRYAIVEIAMCINLGRPSPRSSLGGRNKPAVSPGVHIVAQRELHVLQLGILSQVFNRNITQVHRRCCNTMNRTAFRGGILKLHFEVAF